MNERRIVILRRNYCDWQTEQLWPKALPYEERWNREFRVTYRDYRHAIQKLADEARSLIPGAVFENININDNIKTGTFYIPVDDDDFFRPDILEVVRQKTDDKTLFAAWKSVTFKDGLCKIDKERKAFQFCETNTYGFLAQTHKSGKLYRHNEAEFVFRKAKVTVIDQPLSVINQTPASFSAIEYKGGVDSIYKSVKTYLKGMRELLSPQGNYPECLDWCRVHFERILELTERL